MWLNIFRPDVEYQVQWDVVSCVQEEVIPPPVITGQASFNSNIVCVATPPAASLIRYECDGFDRYKVENDGTGKVTTTLVERNSGACGYVPPVISSEALFTGLVCVETDPSVPPNGTVIGTICHGFDLYNVIANGDGTTREVLVQINSSGCNYVPPLPRVWLENELVETNNYKVDVVSDIAIGSISVSIGIGITYRKNGGSVQYLGTFQTRTLTPTTKRATLDMQSILQTNRGAGTYQIISTGALGPNFFDLEKNDAQVFVITTYVVIPLKRVQNPD